MTEVLELFRIIAPEFEIADYPDTMILAKIEFYQDFCSKRRFGKYWSRAVALLIAHFLTLEKLAQEDGAAGGFITGGGLTAEKEGDLQRNFGASTANDLYEKTLYGKEFLLLQKMCIVPATIRIGRDECGRKGY